MWFRHLALRTEETYLQWIRPAALRLHREAASARAGGGAVRSTDEGGPGVTAWFRRRAYPDNWPHGKEDGRRVGEPGLQAVGMPAGRSFAAGLRPRQGRPEWRCEPGVSSGWALLNPRPMDANPSGGFGNWERFNRQPPTSNDARCLRSMLGFECWAFAVFGSPTVTQPTPTFRTANPGQQLAGGRALRHLRTSR
jgi:hypothetical protein